MEVAGYKRLLKCCWLAVARGSDHAEEETTRTDLSGAHRLLPSPRTRLSHPRTGRDHGSGTRPRRRPPLGLSHRNPAGRSEKARGRLRHRCAGGGFQGAAARTRTYPALDDPPAWAQGPRPGIPAVLSPAPVERERRQCPLSRESAHLPAALHLRRYPSGNRFRLFPQRAAHRGPRGEARKEPERARCGDSVRRARPPPRNLPASFSLPRRRYQ